VPYEDVPQRIIEGESVPRSEIIGYMADTPRVQVDLILHRLVDLFVLERVIEDERLHYRITSLGTALRIDYVRRIEGDCPECP
jgi:hypothetical protein